MKARALQWLAQREQSRVELRRKLLPYAVAEDAAALEAGSSALELAPELVPAARVEAVLDWLASHNYLSQERFVESRVHARASRFGNLRIRQELKQHQLTLSPEATQALRETELQRALAVHERKFGQRPSSAAERAKHARFLAGRGFSPEVIGRVLRRAIPMADEAEISDLAPATTPD